MNHGDNALTRREMLARMGTGLPLLGLASVLADSGLLAAASPAAPGRPAALDPLAARPPQFPGRAKHVIHIYLNGGPSQVDTFDPKPLLKKYEGQTLPTGNLTTERKTGYALPSPFAFRRFGKSGLEISEIFEKTAAHADEMCIIRS